jgi:hypothetical protein
MADPKDDLEAVRAVAEALNGFDASEQERIIRWAREKLGLASLPVPSVISVPSVLSQPASGGHTPTSKSLKDFVSEKNPKNDVQFAATVAYFYRFEGSPEGRKNEINSDDLQEGCRLAGRVRLKNPGQTLQNAHKLGLLDRAGRGLFTINSVGENLVAMTLPGDSAATSIVRTRKKKESKGKPEKSTRPKGRKR